MPLRGIETLIQENIHKDVHPDNDPGSLNRLRQLLHKQQCCVKNYALLLYAGDNGISWEGTSRYEPMSSSKIVEAHLRGESLTSRFLNRIGCCEFIADIGLSDNVEHPALLNYKIRRGSRSFLDGDALTAGEVEQAFTVGHSVWERIAGGRFDLIGIGEIGVGDTLCAAAIASVLTGNYPGYMTGSGSSDDKVIDKKIDIIVKAVSEKNPEMNYKGLLTRFGGLEIAGLTGFILEAVKHGVPVMLDGYVTAVAALLASFQDDRVSRYVIAPSLSLEQGHQIILDRLGIEPVFRFDFSHGEGLASIMGMFLAELVSAF